MQSLESAHTKIIKNTIKDNANTRIQNTELVVIDKVQTIKAAEKF